MKIDDQCSVCCALLRATIELERVSRHIEITCSNQKRKKDFGLEQTFIKKQIKELKRMQRWHQYYHATGEALNDADVSIDSSSGNAPKRFRPGSK